MQTVLVPTDFSENAKAAANFALLMFRKKAKKIILLHTYYIPYTDTGLPFNLGDSIAEQVTRNLEQEKERLEQQYADFEGTVELRFVSGDVVSAVKKMHENQEFDAVVMGTKGAGGLDEVLVGSRTSHMVKVVDCPIFVVPENAPIRTPKNLLLTSDLKTFVEGWEFDPVREIAEDNDSELTILHVNDGSVDRGWSRFIQGELDFDFFGIKHRFEEMKHSSVVKGIDAYVESNPVDLLIAVTNRGNLLYRLFHRSITKKLVLHSKIPLLVLPHADD